MTVVKKSESTSVKQWRLAQIRKQMKEFEQWFHPAPDEIAHLCELAREWAKLDELNLSAKELTSLGNSNSMFPRLIQFCTDELNKIVKYCESRKSSGKPTIRDSDVQMIKLLANTDDLDTAEALCLCLEYVAVADALARIKCTCYRALRHPFTLNELSIANLRGDILEVIACTYADINTVLLEQAEKGIKQGTTQVKTTIKACNKNRKLTDNEMNKMITEAKKLKVAHPNWASSALAKQLAKEFSAVSWHTIRKYDWLIKLTTP
jgi:hypothetical protein